MYITAMDSSYGGLCLWIARFHSISPLRCVDYSVFRPYNLMFWSVTRMDALGFRHEVLVGGLHCHLFLQTRIGMGWLLGRWIDGTIHAISDKFGNIKPAPALTRFNSRIEQTISYVLRVMNFCTISDHQLMQWISPSCRT